ncbi:30S ribosomal protein S8 [[Mycoplasma] mobile]|uniref:Small ribosomal subunit protein uS8 n=1 Tax=Mycoplasma mobile (strain ATCC 43663 / 163K / NCTC 11711) TaxID=267748 RepID=RS8_MYCM1|nr:30S ribosomal protein S8 [[Mycoplasma] mobile]Q6KI41.1 RecName: Full=Small ribosomal subunit protein uS8; AltName: Full=30S ribosomal protein S8 [Mycoplasma mobile 163K]AAT27735.1 30S ribosomal protein s8 [Mycoplasma mobile 163K]
MSRVITDPIADMLVRIKNATARKHKNVLIPFSNKKSKILEIIKDQGYIFDFAIEGDSVKKNLNVTLKYKNNISVITGVKRISKPGLKVYSSVEDLPMVLNGYGIAIISTSKGVLTDKQARKENVGGEIVAYIW